MTRFPNEWSVKPRVRDSNERKRLWFIILAWFLFAGFWQLTLKSVMAFFFLLFGALAEDMPVFSSDSLERLISHSSSSRFVRCRFFAWNSHRGIHRLGYEFFYGMYCHLHEKCNMQISERIKFRRFFTLLIKSFVFLQGIVTCIKIQWFDQLAWYLNWWSIAPSSQGSGFEFPFRPVFWRSLFRYCSSILR